MKLLKEIDSLTQIDIEVLMSRGLRELPALIGLTLVGMKGVRHLV
jgi:hypothetical protein